MYIFAGGLFCVGKTKTGGIGSDPRILHISFVLYVPFELLSEYQLEMIFILDTNMWHLYICEIYRSKWCLYQIELDITNRYHLYLDTNVWYLYICESI